VRSVEMTNLLQLGLRISPGNAEFYPQTDLWTAAHNQRTAGHEWRIALELSAQSSSCMRRKLFLYTALPIAFPRRSPAA
jgi:hypothetical protein